MWLLDGWHLDAAADTRYSCGMKRVLFLASIVAVSACSPNPEPCDPSDSIWHWTWAATSGGVSWPADACGMQTSVAAKLGANGAIELRRWVPAPSGKNPYLRIDSGVEDACASVDVSLGAEKHSGTVADFPVVQPWSEARIEARTAMPCVVTLRPRVSGLLSTR